MTKEDWIKLAMPASITLLAMAIVTQPMVSNAFPSEIVVKQNFSDSWDINSR